MKTRAKSLLQPYIVWNTITILAFAALHLFAKGYINPKFENVPQWSVSDYLVAFWNGSGGNPISYPLWFLRNLIVMTVASPLFYLAVFKFGRTFSWIVLTAIMAIHIFIPVGGGWVTSIFYFYVGTMIAKYWQVLNKYSIHRYKLIACVSALLFLISVIISTIKQDNSALYNTTRLFGSITYVLTFVGLTNKGLNVPKLLSDSSFFLYLYHPLALMGLGRLLIGILHPCGLHELICVYLLNLSTITLIGVFLFVLMRKYTPAVLKILIGNR